MIEAEAMYLRALAGNKKACGPEHKSTLSMVKNLASLYTNQGKITETEAIASAEHKKLGDPSIP